MLDYLDNGVLVESDYFDACVLDYLDRMVREETLTNAKYRNAHKFILDDADKRFNKYLRDELINSEYWEDIKDILDEIIYAFIKETATQYRAQDVDAPAKLDEPELNSHNVNANIVFHELDEKSMLAAGFKKLNDGTWSYSRTETYKYLNLCFWVHKKPGDDLAIDILDDDFCQPYDYQHMEAQGNVTEYTRFARKFTEQQMQKLAQAGILSGHNPGDYI